MEWALLRCLLVLLVAASPAASSGEAGTSISTAAWVRGTGGGGRIAWDSNITLLGEASRKNGSISLTCGTLTSGIGAGRALYSRPVRFLDAATRAPASFATSFAFSIRPSNSSSSASAHHRHPRFPCFGDGLAFLLTSDPRFLGAAHGFLGLFSDSAAEHDPATVAVEFDTNLDPLLHDMDDNHVGVDGGAIFSTAVAPACDAGVDLKKGVPMTAWVDYQASRKTLRVWLGYSRSRPRRPLLVAPVDLSALLREFMYVGFSASNGRGAALHLVHSWSFRTFGFSSSSPSRADGNDSVSGGDELPNPANDTSPPPPPPPCLPRLGPLIGGVVGFLFLIAASTTVTLWLRFRCDWDCGDWDCGDCGDCDCGGDEEASSTRSRSSSSVNGEPRMRVQAAGSKAAVKRFGRVEHLTGTFAAELAAVVARCRHQNLVPLAGWCCENNELLLVYEFMPNGTLDRALHSSPDRHAAAVLPWGVRKNVVLGVASALAFLHDDREKRIVHRDVKSCNILLDADFNAKLGDFGLALLNSRSSSGCAAQASLQPAGTIGYMAPEYVRSGMATDRSDVYSFGVVALEVATGRLPVDEGLVLVDWVWELWGRRRLLEAADPRLRGRFREEEMARMLIVGLSCSHPDSNKRPRMRKAIRMLRGTAPLPSLPARKPAVRLPSPLPLQLSSSSTTAQATCSRSSDQDTCSRSSGYASTANFSCS